MTAGSTTAYTPSRTRQPLRKEYPLIRPPWKQTDSNDGPGANQEGHRCFPSFTSCSPPISNRRAGHSVSSLIRSRAEAFGGSGFVVQDENQPPHQQQKNNGQGAHRYFSTKILLVVVVDRVRGSRQPGPFPLRMPIGGQAEEPQPTYLQSRPAARACRSGPAAGSDNHRHWRWVRVDWRDGCADSSS